jgi:hypothetical protein
MSSLEESEAVDKLDGSQMRTVSEAVFTPKEWDVYRRTNDN